MEGCLYAKIQLRPCSCFDRTISCHRQTDRETQSRSYYPHQLCVASVKILIFGSNCIPKKLPWRRVDWTEQCAVFYDLCRRPVHTRIPPLGCARRRRRTVPLEALSWGQYASASKCHFTVLTVGSRGLYASHHTPPLDLRYIFIAFDVGRLPFWERSSPETGLAYEHINSC